MLKFGWFVAVLLLLVAGNSAAQLNLPVGGDGFKGWSGNGVLSQGQTATFRYPDGKSYAKGFRTISDNVCDWSGYAGLSFDVLLKKEGSAQLEVTIKVPQQDGERLQAVSLATVDVYGKGWHTVFVPWSRFNINRGQLEGVLRSVKEVGLSPKTIVGNSVVQFRDAHVTQGPVVAMTGNIQGKSAKPGPNVVYSFEVGNASRVPQAVSFAVPRVGWESMAVQVSPQTVLLQPGETTQCRLTVAVASHLPAGVRESQVVEAYANGMATASLRFETAVTLPKPNIVHTAKGWQEVIYKVDHYDWAKAELANYEKTASAWTVPNVAVKISNDNADKGLHLFETQEEWNLMAAAIAYRLTLKMEYAQKVALFLNRLSSETTGYPTTFRGCSQSSVQEGHFFQHIAMAYDMIYDSGALSPDEVARVENTFRLFIETVRGGFGQGGINNWALSSITGALYCALAIEDWHLANDILQHPAGVYNHLMQGVMSDGWWYECTVGYNVWCAGEFSQIALALQPWGINFKDMEFPIGTSPYYSLMPNFKKPGLYGMNFDKWGSIEQNSISVRDMWDALLAFVDYRGIMFAVNDANETQVTGQPFELAYYLYRDPEYAAVINRGTRRDLLYGVGELPRVESQLAKQSAYADNMGIVQLRSNKEGRPQREQIQAALHYGTHGGFHGHFDRTNFLEMMRYGRSFYNPEMIWYGYPSYLYKFLVQTSMTKNMVVVDQKMQEPQESSRTLFYTGKMLQATAVETKARWSNPPYGGMRYDYLGGISFKEKAWQESRGIDFPAQAPAYGQLTGFTEPVLQRRLMVMMDDYVVLADYLKADSAHTFDWLFHMKGFKGVAADEKTVLRHDAQMNPDPLGAAQFITDCQWYNTQGTARSSFEMCWGEGCDNAGTIAPRSENGPLKIDVFNAWPLNNDIMVGTVPEPHGGQKRVWYSVVSDGDVLLSDSTAAWILGSKAVEVDVTGKKQLSLIVKTDSPDRPNLFWGDAVLVLQDGRTMDLRDLSPQFTNVLSPAVDGADYFGGPVKIEGEASANALPAMPKSIKANSVVTIDLTGLDAVRFKARIGADFPYGDESSRRKTLAVRSAGTRASYLSVIEPYETESVIKRVTALNGNVLEVELKDGRVQLIEIENLDIDGGPIAVRVSESINGTVVRRESTDDK